MLLINKLSASSSMFNLSNTNKRKRTSTSITSIAPLLQRLKKSFIHTSTEYENKPVSTAKRSNTMHCWPSEKEEIPSIKNNSNPNLFKTSNTKCYPLRLENSNSNHKYTQAIENWWSTSPPIHYQQQNDYQYSRSAVMAC